jgi:FkbM family methyltransferase
MRRFDQWVFPDGEAHLPKRMTKWNLRVDGRLTYQYPLYEQARGACRLRRVAVDVGAHVGLFSYWMVRDFAQLVAVEPVEAHRACWVVNVPARPGDVLHGCALGAAEGAVRMEGEAASTGGTRVAGPGSIRMATLDSFQLPVIDLLKIDVEGYELEVLQGGAETLARCRPVVCVEQRPRQVASFGHGAADAVDLLARLGARVVWTDRRDYVLSWAGR